MADPLLSLENVSLSYHKKIILSDVSFTVNPGEIVTLIGPNGAGKSTLMKIALGLLRADSGTVKRCKNIVVGYMPQKVMIDPILPLTVRQFLELRPQSTAVEDILGLVRITGVIDTPIQAVSGGEMQRVMLARALMGSPDLLVLDEPVQGLDINSQNEIYKLIVHIRDTQGCGVLMISHDLHLVMAATDQVICLNHHVCCSGAPEAVQSNPEYHALMTGGSQNVALYSHHHDHHHDSGGNVVDGDHGPGCDHD